MVCTMKCVRNNAYTGLSRFNLVFRTHKGEQIFLKNMKLVNWYQVQIILKKLYFSGSTNLKIFG